MSSPADPRLPRLAVPSAYRIELAPDLAEFTFTGSVEIDVEILELTDRLVLNAIELTIHTATISIAGTEHTVSIDLDETTERLTLSSDTTLPPGPATVAITFDGLLNDQLHGFYRSSYADAAGVEHTIATTQFQSTDARRCFPCWDEPAYKATFETTLIVDAEHLAVSNTAEVDRRAEPDGRMRVRFAPTMIMSTYLVAFVVGPLEATEPIDADGVPVRVVHRPGQAHLTGFALDVAAHALGWLSDYFAIPYPSDKVDLIAIPDFAFGAMENLGCVTFREVLLLVDPDEASQPELQVVADVINHELAHMWFGDLVTMQWWEGIWLNEAFATFMETSCSDAYRPDWRVWDTFARARAQAFDVDALSSTRPIEYPVLSPQDAEGMFDLLTYEKGAAVVRMLEQYLGADVFRDGVRHYIATHAYKNTKTTDLWHSLELVSGQPVQALMHAWIFQGGHPVVTATVTPHGLRLEQHHFTLDPSKGDDRTWAIPLVIRHSGGTTSVLMDQPSMLLTGITDAPLTVSEGANGFLRTAIAIDALPDPANLSPAERHSVVDDAWAACVAGSLTAAEFLRLCRHFAGEDDLNVWQAISTGLHGLDRLVDDDTRPTFQAAVRELAEPILARIGPEPATDDSDRTRELRATLVRVLGTVGGSPTVIAAAAEALDHNDASLAAAALAVVSHNGGEDDYDIVHDRWRSADDPQSEVRNLRALAHFPSVELVDRLLTEIGDGSVRTQDAPYVLARAMHNRFVDRYVWAYVRDNWADLDSRFPSNSIPRMLSGITALDQPDLVNEVADFLADHPIPQAGKQVEQHLERQAINARLRDREHEQFNRSLRS